MGWVVLSHSHVSQSFHLNRIPFLCRCARVCSSHTLIFLNFIHFSLSLLLLLSELRWPNRSRPFDRARTRPPVRARACIRPPLSARARPRPHSPAALRAPPAPARFAIQRSRPHAPAPARLPPRALSATRPAIARTHLRPPVRVGARPIFWCARARSVAPVRTVLARSRAAVYKLPP